MKKYFLALPALLLLASCGTSAGGNSTQASQGGNKTLTAAQAITVCNDSFNGVIKAVGSNYVAPTPLRAMKIDGNEIEKGTNQYAITSGDAAGNACWIYFLGSLYTRDQALMGDKVISFKNQTSTLTGGNAFDLDILANFDLTNNMFQLDVAYEMSGMGVHMAFDIGYNFDTNRYISYHAMISAPGYYLNEAVTEDNKVYAANSNDGTVSEEFTQQLEARKQSFATKKANATISQLNITSELDEVDALSRSVSSAVTNELTPSVNEDK